MPELSENFLTAPKDGSVFNVQFSGGEATKARWNSQAAEFEVLRETGEWVKMTYDRGKAKPRFWWRAQQRD